MSRGSCGCSRRDATAWWTIHELHLGCTVPGINPDANPGPGDPDPVPASGVDPDRAHWSATASVSDGGAVTNAIDGDATSRWATGRTPQYGDEWLRVDLSTTHTIHEVRVSTSGGDYASAFALDLSTDDQTYTEVARGLGADLTRITFPPTAARYVKVRQIGSGYDHWWSITDLHVIE